MMAKQNCHIDVDGYGDWLHYRFINGQNEMVMEVYLLYTARETVGDIIAIHARCTNMGQGDGTLPEVRD